MFAIGAVGEGYPSPGWAAALGHLPAVLAVPICLATASCLLSPLVWLAFFAGLTSSWQSHGWQRALVFVPGVILGVPIICSAIALIYFPEVLARPWPLVLSSTPVRLIQDIAGVAPLLFFNALPAYWPGVQVVLLDLWVRRDDPLPYDRRLDVSPCMASVWKSSGTSSARRALFRCPCLWRCGRSKPLGAKLVEVVREFAAHIPFHAGGVPRHVFAFSARAADIGALRSHRRRAGGGGKSLTATNVAFRRNAR
jgi:hypothetical protein